MAHARSAIKRHRQELRRRARNQARRTGARSAVRRVRELIAAGTQEEAAAAVREASSILDRAARKGVLHANNAARRKSRLMRQLNTMQEVAPPKRRARAPAKTRASGTKASGRRTTGRSARSEES